MRAGLSLKRACMHPYTASLESITTYATNLNEELGHREQEVDYLGSLLDKNDIETAVLFILSPALQEVSNVLLLIPNIHLFSSGVLFVF